VNFKNVDFVKKRKLFFIISAVIQVIGVICLLVIGFNLGVDFKSGTRMDIFIGTTFTEAEIREEVKSSIGLEPGSVEVAGDNKERAAVRFGEPLSKDQIASVKNHFTETYGDQVDIQESTVDPIISRELARQAVYAVLLASIGIIIYVTIRFEYRFAIAAIIALLHDALGVIFIFSILQLEVDLPFIAAILTIVGYSINDTIVTFDRIRENMRKYKMKKMEDLEHVVNVSIQETITRSINTVLTVAFAAFSLYVFGGESIQNFALALLIGLIFGAYSSIFIASQLWLVWKGRELKKTRLSQANNEAS
jgi:preprotein translocase subunit SecF